MGMSGAAALLAAHVFAAVSFGGILLGCLVQTLLALGAPAGERGRRDPVVPAALLGLGLPAGMVAGSAGAVLAGETGLAGTGWVGFAAGTLGAAAVLAGSGGLLALGRMTANGRDRFGLLMAQGWLLGGAWLCWAAGLVAMVRKGG